jgi:hypothetical protein
MDNSLLKNFRDYKCSSLKLKYLIVIYTDVLIKVIKTCLDGESVIDYRYYFDDSGS